MPLSSRIKKEIFLLNLFTVGENRGTLDNGDQFTDIAGPGVAQQCRFSRLTEGIGAQVIFFDDFFQTFSGDGKNLFRALP